jgi:hypothetical protein
MRNLGSMSGARPSGLLAGRELAAHDLSGALRFSLPLAVPPSVHAGLAHRLPQLRTAESSAARAHLAHLRQLPGGRSPPVVEGGFQLHGALPLPAHASQAQMGRPLRLGPRPHAPRAPSWCAGELHPSGVARESSPPFQEKEMDTNGQNLPRIL